MSKQKHIPVVKFHSRKYGDKLLIDVVGLDTIRRSPNFAPVLRQSFYGIMLTTGGEGKVDVDGHRCSARKGLVACARPGDVCSIVEDGGLASLQLIFEREFLLSFFADPHFLDGIACLSPRRSSPYLWLDEAQYSRVVALYDALLIELHTTERRNPHLLRAMLYEVLVLLQMAGSTAGVAAVAAPLTAADRVSRFRQLVDEHYLTHSGVQFYADNLCITPNYLDRIVRQSLGISTKRYIQRRRMEEAKRLLRYTNLPVAGIAERLGFDTTSYFIRAFAKEEGTTPLQYRTTKTE